MRALSLPPRSVPPFPHSISSLPTRSSSLSFPCHRVFQCVSLAAPSLVKDDAAKFKEASRNGNLVPLRTCIFSDHLTPILAYRCLVKEGDLEVPSFVFESVLPGAQGSTVGRYSVVGAQPCMEIVAKADKIVTMDHENGLRTEELVEDPMVIPRRIAEGWKPQLIDELPDAFCGGWVGFFSCNMVHHVEKKKLLFSKAPEDERNLADIHLALYDDVIVFDHVEKKVHVIHWVRLDLHSSIEKAYTEGRKRLEILLSRVIDPPNLSPGCLESHIQSCSSSLNESNMTSETYQKAVVQAKKHILAGNIFQMGLSPCFERRTFADPFEVYRALRVVNPSPFMAYLQARGCILAASSPESLTQVSKNSIVDQPLSGTVGRGTRIHGNGTLKGELINDEKQCPEHSMLVDLAQNDDVGKVAKFDSEKVEELNPIEQYLQVRAMEWVDGWEEFRHGPYGGGFGSVSFTGEMEISSSLRAVIFPTGNRHNTLFSYGNAKLRREWVAYFQAGAKIVADGVPSEEDEQSDCKRKAAALAHAIDLAEAAFVKK